MKHSIFIICCFLAFSNYAQESLPTLLKKYNTKNIPYIAVHELAMPKTQALVLDAREKEEYHTSHLKDAILVGYNNFSIDSVINKIPNKNDTIVVYCSIGIRSETIAHKLKKAGYRHVLNLYGGIFEWKNNHFPIYNSENKETEKVHIFSKEWSTWLTSGIKVY